VVISAWQSGNGGAARAYFTVRYLDGQGAGKVTVKGLEDLYNLLGVAGRSWRRWLSDALKLGLMKKYRLADGCWYFGYVSLGRAALLMGAERVGAHPVVVGLAEFLGHGWRAAVWGGYVAAQGGRPVSQAVKRSILGVSERSQSRYQAVARVKKITNYTDRGAADPGRVEGLRDACGMAVFERRGRVRQKLPDILVVPTSSARVLRRGRSRKATKDLNYSLSRERDKCLSSGRLFCVGAKQVKTALRRIIQDGLGEEEVFEFLHNLGGQVNLWRCVGVGAR
jgi:hypothetical protein